VDRIIIVILSSFKFAATFPLAVVRLSFTETLIWTNIGGILGVYFFSGLSKLILDFWQQSWLKKKISPRKEKNKQKKVFTKRSRKLIKIKSRYGFPGIVILNPVILSIPVAAFLVVRYYKHIKYKYFYLILGLVGWSMIYTFFYELLYEKISLIPWISSFF
jgi:hypothetical protein